MAADKDFKIKNGLVTGGDVTVTGTVTTNRLTITGSPWATIFKGTNQGLIIQPITGAFYDLYVPNAANNAGIMWVPTGTQNVEFGNNVQVTGTATASSFSGAGTGLTGTAASLNIGGTATRASNVAGGLANGILYNSAVNATASIAAPTTANTYLRWNGSTFVWSTLPFDVAQFINGKPLASEILVKVIFPRAVSFPANFSGSYAKCVIAPTASTVLSVLKNGIEVGTLTFGAGATTGTFSTSALSFSAADLMIIQAPASVDATFADFACTLSGA